MKTAIERFLETTTVQEKQRLMAEKEMACFDYNFEPLLRLIEDSIDVAVGQGLFSLKITIAQQPCMTKYNGLIYAWYLISSQSTWKDFNTRANAYYTIPRYDVPVLTADNIITQLKSSGYQCEIKQSNISQASTRTGKYAYEYPAYQITIDWTNNLTLVGVKENG